MPQPLHTARPSIHQLVGVPESCLFLNTVSIWLQEIGTEYENYCFKQTMCVPALVAIEQTWGGVGA